MSRVLKYVPRGTIFLAGVAAAAIRLPRRDRGGMDSAKTDELKRSLASLEARLPAGEATDAARFAQLEIRVDTVSQTDSLLERVLESLDALQTSTDPADFGEDPLLSRSRM